MKDATGAASNQPGPSLEVGGGFRLPRSLTSFVGRTAEIDMLCDLITDPGSRLVTLVGPGGVGKTRLALRVAEITTSHFDETAFVDCAPLTHASQVLPAIADEIGVGESQSHLLADRVALGIGYRQILLLLDNLEHLGSSGSDLVGLLRACPRLIVLATSRAPIRVTGEREVTIAPLPESDAALLFADRSRAVRPAFHITDANRATVGLLCRGLDGLPLAIELAAARMKVLSPEALLLRLEHRLSLLTGGPRDQPPRLHSMREAIAWSHELLDPQERMLFRRLAVFAGSFDLDAAQAITLDAEQLFFNLFETLSSLVDKSLIRVDESSVTPRFRMLETICAFGLEHLELSGERDTVRSAHARFYLRLADTAEKWLITADREPWLRRLEDEHANLRAALDWFDSQSDVASLLRMTGALAWFWYFRAHLEEGRRCLTRAMNAGSQASGLPWADVLRAAARLAVAWGDNEQATIWAEESLEMYQFLGNLRGVATALSTLAALAENRGDDEVAEQCYGESLGILRDLDETLLATFALVNYGDVIYRRGDFDRAAVIADEALGLARELNDPVLMSITLGSTGYIALQGGDLHAAHEAFAEGLQEACHSGHLPGITDLLAGFAALAFRDGEPHLAARWLGAAVSLNEHHGLHTLLHHFQSTQVREAVRRELGDLDFLAEGKDGSTLTMEAAVAEVTGFVRSDTNDPHVQARQDSANLSPREREVLALIVSGQSNRQIGETLFISHRTAQIHVANILAKIGVSSRTAAAVVAVRDGLIEASIPPA